MDRGNEVGLLTFKNKLLSSRRSDTFTLLWLSSNCTSDDSVSRSVLLFTVSWTTTGSWHLYTTKDAFGHWRPEQLPHGWHESRVTRDWHCSLPICVYVYDSYVWEKKTCRPRVWRYVHLPVPRVSAMAHRITSAANGVSPSRRNIANWAKV